MSRRSHENGCECSTCCKPPKEEACCKPEKPCCKPAKPCKAEKPCCCIPGPVGPVGPRGGRGFPAVGLPSGFAELPEIFPIPLGGPTVVLTVPMDSAVARELRVHATYSADTLGDTAPNLLTFKIRVSGIDPAAGAPNGSSVTLDAQNENVPRQFRAGGIVRRYLAVPAGPRTVELIVTAGDIGAQLDPALGGAALLVEQVATS